MKYLRTHPKHLKNVPPHRFVLFVHNLSLEKAMTKAEFLEDCRQMAKLNRVNWSEDKEKTALEALDWLVEVGLAKMVQSTNG